MNKKKYVIEEMTTNLLDLIPDAAALVDKKGRIKLVNHALEETSGFSQTETVGKIFFELDIFSESKEMLIKNLAKRMQGLTVDHYELNFTDKMGKSRCVEVKGKKVIYAKKPADLVILHDITERKRIEQKINESEEKYRRLFEESGEAIFVADAETGIIVDCNPAASELVAEKSKNLLANINQLYILPGWLKMDLPEISKKASGTRRSGLKRR